MRRLQIHSILSLSSACEGRVAVSCREARGAGPLAVSGFQDLKSHSVWYDYGHKALALGALYVINKGLAVACKRAGISFPSPLIGGQPRARLQKRVHSVMPDGGRMAFPLLLVPCPCFGVQWLRFAFMADVWQVGTAACFVPYGWKLCMAQCSMTCSWQICLTMSV